MNFADSRALFSTKEEQEKRKRLEQQEATAKDKQKAIDRIKAGL